jgi:hypothetical protein
MSATKKAARPFTVLVGIDYLEQSAFALTEAIAIARSRPPSHVHVVHALPYVVPAAEPSGAAAPSATGVATVEHSEQLRKYVERVLSESHENGCPARVGHRSRFGRRRHSRPPGVFALPFGVGRGSRRAIRALSGVGGPAESLRGTRGSENRAALLSVSRSS